jgi:hypothetical protein
MEQDIFAPNILDLIGIQDCFELFPDPWSDFELRETPLTPHHNMEESSNNWIYPDGLSSMHSTHFWRPHVFPEMVELGTDVQPEWQLSSTINEPTHGQVKNPTQRNDLEPFFFDASTSPSLSTFKSFANSNITVI